MTYVSSISFPESLSTCVYKDSIVEDILPKRKIDRGNLLFSKSLMNPRLNFSEDDQFLH